MKQVIALLLVLMLLVTSTAEAYGRDTSLMKAQEFERLGLYSRAAVFYCQAYREGVSEEARSGQSRCIRKMLSFGDSSGSGELSGFFTQFWNAWNNHDVSSLISHYDQSFLSSDGFTRSTIKKIAGQLWKAYPDARSYWELKDVWSDGTHARALVVSKSVGNTSGFYPITATSILHDLFSLEKKNGRWRITSQFVVSYKEKDIQGMATSAQVDMVAPDAVESGRSYNAKVTAILPAMTQAYVTMGNSVFTFPLTYPKQNWVAYSGNSLSQTFLANRGGSNELVGAQLKIVNPMTGATVGQAILAQHVCVSAAPDVVATLTNYSGGVSSPTSVASVPSASSRPMSTTREKTSIATAAGAEKQSFLQSAGKSLASRPVKDKWALIVGIGKFEDKRIPRLEYSAKDARDFYDFLIKEGNFKRDHIRLLVDEKATKRRILSELATHFLFRVVGPEDLVVIYFSTHGSPTESDPGGNNYLVAYDTVLEELFATGLEMQTIMRTLKERIKSKRILLVLDACHSGATKVGSKGLARVANFDAAAIAQGTGQLVICSSEPQERSWESKRYNNGVFTRNLIQGLKKNGSVTKLKAAFDFLRNHVAREVRQDRGTDQTPVLKSKWNGNDLCILAPPVDPQPVPKSLLEQLKPDSSNE